MGGACLLFLTVLLANIFIDRDPVCFVDVLDYLRGNTMETRLLMKNRQTAVRREFQYFNIQWRQDEWEYWYSTVVNLTTKLTFTVQLLVTPSLIIIRTTQYLGQFSCLFE